MIDFMKISTRQVKKGVTEIFPKFVLKKSSDLMIRGGDFYAVWNEDRLSVTNSNIDKAYFKSSKPVVKSFIEENSNRQITAQDTDFAVKHLLR